MEELSKNKLFLLFEKLKKDKKMLFVIVLSFLGVLLILFSEIVPAEKEDLSSAQSEEFFLDEGRKEELEAVISEIKGAGKVRVMITYEGTSENIYAHNFSQQNNDTDSKSEEEHIILDKGNTEDGLLIKEVYPKVTGVAVVCEGGGDPIVKNEINQMLKALFNISSNSISISEMRS